ncbi:MAG: hypothetical protein UZ07_CHB004002535, partial [Chlorobi bacterium OLB7]
RKAACFNHKPFFATKQECHAAFVANDLETRPQGPANRAPRGDKPRCSRRPTGTKRQHAPPRHCRPVAAAADQFTKRGFLLHGSLCPMLQGIDIYAVRSHWCVVCWFVAIGSGDRVHPPVQPALSLRVPRPSSFLLKTLISYGPKHDFTRSFRIAAGMKLSETCRTPASTSSAWLGM